MTSTAVPPTALPKPREVLDAFGVYIHVPFCTHRCWYCDFNAYAGQEDAAPRYMAALARDVREARSLPADLDPRPIVTSVFIGGGTPSLVDADALLGVLDALHQGWDVAEDVEITVECNPESVDHHKLEAYRDGGVTRVSFGVQSLTDRLLARLGRVHDADTAREALSAARAAGFERVNADLIIGTPGESDGEVRDSVAGVLDAGATHVSCYGLTYEEGTPLHSWRRLGKVVPVPDDDVARRWELADAMLAEASLVRYEISNWARPGEACRHNELYWACGEYLGAGAGAHGHLATSDGGVRSWTLKAPERYIAAVEDGGSPVVGQETIGTEDRCAEVMFLGLRRAEGVSTAHFEALTGMSLTERYGAEIEACVEDGLVDWDGQTARLTTRGTLLANEALTRFL